MTNCLAGHNDFNYGYVICNCTDGGNVIQVPRPDFSELVRFACPGCGRLFGIYMLGKLEFNLKGADVTE